jgi:hypothetical protein
MKEMTTAEFAKANLAELTEPISIRRYTKSVGKYYPEGYEPATPPQSPAPPDFGLLVPDLPAPAAKRVADLEDEVARLKRELAARPAILTAPKLPDAVSRLQVSKSSDPFSGLAKQDREFFERKLGTKKSK